MAALATRWALSSFLPRGWGGCLGVSEACTTHLNPQGCLAHPPPPTHEDLAQGKGWQAVWLDGAHKRCRRGVSRVHPPSSSHTPRVMPTVPVASEACHRHGPPTHVRGGRENAGQPAISVRIRPKTSRAPKMQSPASGDFFVTSRPCPKLPGLQVCLFGLRMWQQHPPSLPHALHLPTREGPIGTIARTHSIVRGR